VWRPASTATITAAAAWQQEGCGWRQKVAAAAAAPGIRDIEPLMLNSKLEGREGSQGCYHKPSHTPISTGRDALVEMRRSEVHHRPNFPCAAFSPSLDAVVRPTIAHGTELSLSGDVPSQLFGRSSMQCNALISALIIAAASVGGMLQEAWQLGGQGC